MGKHRFNQVTSAEDVYFVSKELPSERTLLRQIYKCLPSKYHTMDDFAVRSRFLFDKRVIHFKVTKMDSNRYRIRVYYDYEPNILAGLTFTLGIALGGIIGYSIYRVIGAVVGVILGGFIVDKAYFSSEQEEVERACENIIQGIKEYERSHQLGISENS